MKTKYLLIIAMSLITVACSRDNDHEQTISNEEAEIQRLYRAAVDAGETEITIWGGGDTPTQLNWIINEWEATFPEIKINIRVDLSKFLDVEIDQELANNTLTPDIVHIQTVQNFHRWKAEGHLENYKPWAWDLIPSALKDPDGAFTPVYYITFAMLANRNNVSALPETYADLLTPEYRNNLILTYPHDDDAVIFLWKKIIDQYGWEYVDRILEQNPRWVRGTAGPHNQVRFGNELASFGTAGVFDTTRDNGAQVILPRVDPFVTWGQTAGIFKLTKNKNAAKLYLNWLLSPRIQRDVWIEWSIRTDLPIKGGYDFRTFQNTSPIEYVQFLLDTEAYNEIYRQMEERIGPVQGGSPLTDPQYLDLLTNN
ncbi:ABC transporter substrate-binding protein [Sphingobacterium chungjuense]|uniref:ABC transporter substrate-binding protein n=1 Tax=Sphingobacterium chungjuense TaxID=2675553 RepID=UPI001408B503|nr:ABC transporter substrate-binding protein [Sphingobacterium chungjuense]